MAAYALQGVINGTIDMVRMNLVASLRDQGFVVLMAVDLREVLRERMGNDLEPYYVLDVLAPDAAQQALNVDRRLGLFFPTRIVLKELDARTEIFIADPRVFLEMAEPRQREALAPITRELHTRLMSVLELVRSDGE